MLLKNNRIAYFVEDGFEDLEFWVPVMRLREEGAVVTMSGQAANRRSMASTVWKRRRM